MTAGVPVNKANTIAGSARATFQVRYIVGTEVNDILPVLRSHLGAHGFNDIEIFDDDQMRWAAASKDTDNIWLKSVLDSWEKRWSA